MIKLTRINKVEKFWVNENQIEFMEETPDTILSMVTGKKIAVAESAEEIAELIRRVQRAVLVTRAENGEVVFPH
ncbi:flagellar protein FlbD [Sporobacter termitidis DSM 10068]|uniref:Flagellar protein FlbD n=1 Tax=Sporobacter termitidis DSM 10068 TaxID=1123282 RepID=A0A1M5W815_9FIRM|nr:flagellar FlbD family protein [Sporobacter termitidis]SHH83662.1 flagellar protein FlbD [Sporobacter termitidis DSM 10068]